MSLTIWEDVGVPALRALVASAQGGYADLEHTMWFRRADGFSSPDELQTGDVFQRAVVLETLISQFLYNKAADASTAPAAKP